MKELQDDLKIYSEEVRDVLSDPPKAILKWGNTILFLFVILIGLLSWNIKYPDIILSQATITTVVPPQKILSQITGKLDKIFVEDNQIVANNEPLALFENTANYKDILLFQSLVDTIKIDGSEIIFPIDKLPPLFLGEIDSDFALFENNYLQYALNKDLKPFTNEAIANRFSLSELNTRLDNMKSQKDINQSELAFKKKDLERNQTLYDKGVISAMEFESKQLEYLQAERNFTSMSASTSQLRESISNAKSISRGTQISSTKENITLLKNVIQSFTQVKNSIKDWELKYLLKSDMEGKVSFQEAWTENQTINQGEVIFTIIPSHNSNFIARLKTPARNSGKIKVGQKANIKLDNYPFREFGSLKGEVKTISLVPDKEGLYRIEVSLPSKLTTSYGKEIDFKQEMTGTAEIITEDLRLIQRFLYQFRDIFSR